MAFCSLPSSASAKIPVARCHTSPRFHDGDVRVVLGEDRSEGAPDVRRGVFDSLNSCSGNTVLLSQIPPGRSSKITFECYEGGHMMYEDRDARFRLKRDIARFYQGARR